MAARPFADRTLEPARGGSRAFAVAARGPRARSPVLAQRYRAQSIPMLLLMERGQVVDTMIGAQPAPILRSRIAGALDRRG